MWPLKSAKINTFSQKQIESHIFQHISTSRILISTRHCQSPRTQLLVYNYLDRHFHRDHYCLSKNRGRSHLSLILRQCNRLFEHRFFWQPHLTNWTIALVIIGIHLSTLFFTPQSIWLWQTRTTHVHFIIVPDYHLIVGTANCPLCSWKSIRLRLIFSKHVPS